MTEQYNGRKISETTCHFCGEPLSATSVFVTVAPEVVVGYCCHECFEADHGE
jgi:hypothetical protein